ncbi:Aste57867_23885 [Aphanomyces stellatus]|uniref:Aste57867_23885 protein n=1 Tax=Aphanomyces stellatus TaxID=120398 RepID=A0A485LTC4_9STRA|nr:hypothetical protein As57867_023812 [Aphanomyces stellatus]VFU00528.1 Aste57867_23885 [Aphanomyces stellatus]
MATRWGALLLNLAYGQAVAVLLVTQYVFTKYLQSSGVHVPAFQTSFTYVLLALTCLPYSYATKRRPLASLSPWFWLVLGAVDVQANFCTIQAFATDANYAVLGLMLHATIPFVTLLSYLFLRKRYSRVHVAGCAVACAGLAVAFVAAVDVPSATQQLHGNLLSLLASFCFSISNVMQEYAAKVTRVRVDILHTDDAGDLDAKVECLGKMGLVGAVVAVAQMAALGEVHRVAVTTDWRAAHLIYLVGYTLAAVLLHLVVSVLLRVTETLPFNLSLLTSDVYSAVTLTQLFAPSSLPALYWPAWAIQVAGIAVVAATEAVQLPFRRKPNVNHLFVVPSPPCNLDQPRQTFTLEYAMYDGTLVTESSYSTMDYLQSNHDVYTMDYLCTADPHVMTSIASSPTVDDTEL